MPNTTHRKRLHRDRYYRRYHTDSEFRQQELARRKLYSQTHPSTPARKKYRREAESKRYAESLVHRVKASIRGANRVAREKGYTAPNFTAEQLVAAWDDTCGNCGATTVHIQLCVTWNHRTGEFVEWRCRKCHNEYNRLQ